MRRRNPEGARPAEPGSRRGRRTRLELEAELAAIRTCPRALSSRTTFACQPCSRGPVSAFAWNAACSFSSASLPLEYSSPQAAHLAAQKSRWPRSMYVWVSCRALAAPGLSRGWESPSREVPARAVARSCEPLPASVEASGPLLALQQALSGGRSATGVGREPAAAGWPLLLQAPRRSPALPGEHQGGRCLGGLAALPTGGRVAA